VTRIPRSFAVNDREIPLSEGIVVDWMAVQAAGTAGRPAPPSNRKEMEAVTAPFRRAGSANPEGERTA
jgi:hypothetical protein